MAFVLCMSHTVSLGHVDTNDLPLSPAGYSSTHRHTQSGSAGMESECSEISPMRNRKNERMIFLLRHEMTSSLARMKADFWQVARLAVHDMRQANKMKQI